MSRALLSPGNKMAKILVALEISRYLNLSNFNSFRGTFGGLSSAVFAE